MAREPGSRVRNYDIEPSNNPYGPKAVEPHSPWQLLVEEQRAQKKITLRELATRAQIPAGTLFNWVRNKRGCPSRSSYTSPVNARFARALGISEDKLADAYNQSVFKPLDPRKIEQDVHPAPRTSENASALMGVGLKRFLEHLHATGRTEFGMNELDLAASFILGSAVKSLDQLPLENGAPPPAPPATPKQKRKQ